MPLVYQAVSTLFSLHKEIGRTGRHADLGLVARRLQLCGTPQHPFLTPVRPGSRVNLEADMLGKWVRRIMAESGIAAPGPSNLTRETLEEERFGA